MDAEREVNDLKLGLSGVKNQIKLMEERLGKVEAQLKIARQEESHSPIVAPTPPKVAEAHKQITAPPPLPRHIERTPQPVQEAASIPTLEIKQKVTPTKHMSAPVAKTEPSTSHWLKKWLKSIGPEEGLSWEMALGTFWLPRIGLLVLAVGVVLLATLAVGRIPQEYLPYIRVGIGYGIGATLLLAGRFLEKRDVSFGQLLLSGGFAFCHFVTFAAHYFEYTRIIPSAPVAYTLMGTIVVAWGIYAQVRRSQLMAFMVTLLGHFTVAASTLSLEQPVNASVAALILLSLGSAFFMVKNRWYAVAATGMLGSYGNQFLWFYHSPESTELSALLMAMGVVSAYALIYALAEFFTHEELRREGVPMKLRTLYASGNSAMFLGMGLVLMQDFEFSRDKTEYLYFGFAAACAILGSAYLLLRQRDPLYNVYYAKASVAVALGLMSVLDGAALNVSLALESLVLVLFARRSQLPGNRMLVQSAVLLTVLMSVRQVLEMGGMHIHAGEIFSPMVWQVCVIVLILLAVSMIYAKTRWTTFVSPHAIKNDAFRSLLLFCDVAGDADSKPTLLWPNVFSLGAILVFAMYAQRLFDGQQQFIIFSIVGPILAFAALIFKMKPYVWSSLSASALAFVFWNMQAINESSLYPVYLSAFAVGTFYFLGEMSRRFGNSGSESWPYWELKLVPALSGQNTLTYLYVIAGGWLNVGVILQSVRFDERPVILAVCALAAGVYALLCAAPAFGLVAMALSAFTVLTASVTIMSHTSILYALTAIGGIALLAVLGESRYVGERVGTYFLRTRFAPYALYAASAWLSYLCVAEYASEDNRVMLICVLAALALALTRLLHPQALGLCATAILCGVLPFWYASLQNSNPAMPGVWWHFSGISVCALALGADRFFAMTRTFKGAIPGAILVVLAWGLLQYHVVLGLVTGGSFGMGMLMLAFLAYGGLFSSKTAITLSVLGAALHSWSLVLGAYNGQGDFFAVLLGFASFIAYWVLLERGITLSFANEVRTPGKTPKKDLDFIPSYAACGMLFMLGLCLEFLPLTIEWTLAAIIMMGLGFGLAQRHYRYAAFATFALALARAMVIDTRNLEAEFRIISMIAMGIVFLGVAYVYVQARKRQGGVDNALVKPSPTSEIRPASAEEDID